MLDTFFPEIISNTDLNLLSQCELRWFRTRVQWLKKEKDFNIDLSAGSAFASALQKIREAYYNDKKTQEEAIDLGQFYLQEQMEKDSKDLDIDGQLKNPQRMSKALEVYFKKWPLDEEELIPLERTDGTGAIEQSLIKELPLIHPETGKPLIFKGKLDLLAKDGKKIYIVDEKTTKTISYNQTELLQASGQFFGYAWLLKNEGITATEARIRKIAIQVKEIKTEEFIIPITSFALEHWYNSLISKLSSMLSAYVHYKETKKNERLFFVPDYQIGCTAFYRACPFVDSCTLNSGDRVLNDIREKGIGLSPFRQIIWNKETREEIDLKDFLKNLKD